MRGDGERSRRPTSRLRRRRQPVPGTFLRTPEEINAQHEAARAYAGEVTDMLPLSHQYTAGQAAALAWLLELGPEPLTYKVADAEGPTAEAVVRLAERARALMDGAADDVLFPAAYVVGVDYVCHWVQGLTDLAPIPGAEPPGVSPAAGG